MGGSGQAEQYIFLALGPRQSHTQNSGPDTRDFMRLGLKGIVKQVPEGSRRVQVQNSEIPRRFERGVLVRTM